MKILLLRSVSDHAPVRRSRSPSPQGEGALFERAGRIIQRETIHAASNSAPSPGGEGWGEGDRRVRQPRTLPTRTNRSFGRRTPFIFLAVAALNAHAKLNVVATTWDFG